jgi:hypothetical protein
VEASVRGIGALAWILKAPTRVLMIALGSEDEYRSPSLGRDKGYNSRKGS